MINQQKFIESLSEELEAGGFAYATNDKATANHVFGTSFDPVWYTQGAIYRKEDEEHLGEVPGLDYPALTLCFPNEQISVKPEDGTLYSDKRMIELLLTNGVKRLCVWEPTSLRYGVMASSTGGQINEDSLQFSLSPTDACRFSEDLAEFAYLVMRAEYDSFEKIYGGKRKQITPLGWGLVTPHNEGLCEVVAETFPGEGNLNGWRRGFFEKIITLKSTHRGFQPRLNEGVCRDARALLETRLGSYVIESPEGHFFTEEPVDCHENGFSATTYGTEELAKETKKRLVKVNYDNSQEWIVREINRKLIGEFNPCV